MLPGSRQDAEDALQDVFVRAYSGLLANDRQLSLRAWLYRIAHNRCIDELRRPVPPAPEVLELVRPPLHDPIAEAEQREALRRLIQDVRRLPDQQRSALLMRELGGVSYAELSSTLGVSVPAVKSLLVRARVGLASAAEARDTTCAAVREDLVLAHDRGVRPSGIARRHLHDCAGCREFRVRLRGTSRQFAALVPAVGPLAIVAKLLSAGGSAGGSAAASGGAVGTGGLSAAGLVAGAGHVATLLAAAVVTAGGAVEIQHQLAPPAHHHNHRSAQLGLSQSPANGPGPGAGPQVLAAPTARLAPSAAAATSVTHSARGQIHVGTAASGRSRHSLAALAGSAENGAPPGSGTAGSGVPSGTDSSGTPTGTGFPGTGATLPPANPGDGTGTPPPDGGTSTGTPGGDGTGAGIPGPIATGGSSDTPSVPPASPGTPQDSGTPTGAVTSSTS